MGLFCKHITIIQPWLCIHSIPFSNILFLAKIIRFNFKSLWTIRCMSIWKKLLVALLLRSRFIFQCIKLFHNFVKLIIVYIFHAFCPYNLPGDWVKKRVFTKVIKLRLIKNEFFAFGICLILPNIIAFALKLVKAYFIKERGRDLCIQIFMKVITQWSLIMELHLIFVA